MASEFLRRLFRFTRKQLALSAIFGAAALVIRNSGLIIPIYGVFKLDPRWIFSLLAACWGGPAGGLLAGFLATVKPGMLIDPFAAVLPHMIVGFGSRLLRMRGRRCVWACLLWPLSGVPMYYYVTSLFIPSMTSLTLVPVLAFIGISTAVAAMIVGLAVEKRAKFLLDPIKQ